MPTWRATPRQLPPPGLGSGAARPPQPLRTRGSGQLVTFGGRAAGSGGGPGRARRGALRRAAGSAAPRLAPGGRSGYFPAEQLQHFGATLKAGTGGRSPSSPAPPRPGGVKTSERRRGRPRLPSLAGPTCPRGSPAGPRGSGAARPPV